MKWDCTYIVRSGTIENSTIGATPNERNQGQVDCTRHIVRYGSGRNYWTTWCERSGQDNHDEDDSWSKHNKCRGRKLQVTVLKVSFLKQSSM